MDFRDQVKSQVDIVRVIGEIVRLKRAAAGSQRYVGLCPFHTEKTPSFSVHAGHQFFKCFGCGKGGDVFTFLMEIEGLSFFEALKSLAERHGIPIPQRADISDADTRLRAAIYRAHEIAQKHFVAQLFSQAGAEANAYAASRNLLPATIEEFGIGYADRTGTLARALQREGLDAAELEACGLVLRRDDGSWFDRFRNRLMFPIHSEQGKVIAFGGRALGDDPAKYMNSPETPIYRKSQVLYNLHRAKESVRKIDRAVLVEGYMDVIGVYQGGVHEVVASCGTALTNLQVRALRRHTERIVVNFDPDAAGAKAAEGSVQMLLEESMRVRILTLDGEMDPDEYVASSGAGAYREKLDAAPSYFFWLAERARARFDMRSAEGRMQGFREVLAPAIARIPDKLERLSIVNDLAGYLGVERGAILEHMRKSAAGRRSEPKRDEMPSLSDTEASLLRGFVALPALAREMMPRFRTGKLLDTLRGRGAFETLFALIEKEVPLDYASLEARLDPADRELLAATFLSDKNHGASDDSEFDAARAEACMSMLEAAARQRHREELRRRIRAEERSGNLVEALKLTRELMAMEGLRPRAG